jgi:DNA-binding transcriptional ArsR family regulator
MKCAPQAAQTPARAGKPTLRARPLITSVNANELSRLFKTLASETRLRMIHALARAEELCVTDLAEELEMAAQAISNQLQRLSHQRIVVARRDGNRLFYRLADPCIPGLLDLGLCLLEESDKARRQRGFQG